LNTERVDVMFHAGCRYSYDPDLRETVRGMVALMLEAGVDIGCVSFSSDGQGSLPRFNPAGEYAGLGVGKVATLFAEVRRAVREFGVPLEVALRVLTTTPAAYLKLPAKGAVRVGADADLVLLDPDLQIDAVLARGSVMVRDHQLVRLGTFEQDLLDTLKAKGRFMAPGTI